MEDIISINRQFLTIARSTATTLSGELLTGLSRPVLDKLSRLSLDQIDSIARSASVSLISLRLTEAELERLLSLHNGRQAAYALAVMAARAGH